ncbi:serine/threonine protein kinase [Catenulispora sp. GP43]|uniref:serine/threonine-protein kinase n=1 Tax=Catenulispora sp. GP43 TaxID=3156263 RepID=UPI0035189E11
MYPLGAGDPRTMGEYRLLARLGDGGMGTVYLGRTPGGRNVAVKLIRREYAADQEFRRRFRQEVAAARRVSGRWTPPVLDADTEGSQPWVATAYVPGPDLSQAVRQFGPLPTSTVCALGVGLAEGLLAVHGAGLVHRDLKPSNVLLSVDGPRMIDFGIARALDGSATALTQTGSVIGSPGYMAPEQASGQPAGPPSDVFSLGAVLATAATGRSPFGQTGDPVAAMYKVLHDQPDLDGLPDPLHEAVEACLQKDPARRPSPQQVRDLLHSGSPVTVGQPGWLPPAISDSVARLATELLHLETPEIQAPPPPAPTSPPPWPTMTATRLGSPGVTAVPAAPVVSQRPRRSGLLAATILVIAVAMAGTAWAVLGDRSHQNTAGNTQLGAIPSTPAGAGPGAAAGNVPTTSAAVGGGGSAGTATPAGTPGSGSVPAAILGKWSGIAYPAAGVQASVEVTIVQGSVGETVEHSAVTYTYISTSCTGQGVLASASSQEIVVTNSNSSTNAMCGSLEGTAPVQVTYRLNTSGTLQASMGASTAELTKQS